MIDKFCTVDQPMPPGSATKWEHPFKMLSGVSNDKSLVFFVCPVCGHDFMEINVGGVK